MKRREELLELVRSDPEQATDLIVGLGEQVENLEAKVTKLEARLGQNSRNSSKPPSTDPPQTPKRKPRGGSGKKRGGQPGRTGKNRQPTDQPDEIVSHRPEICSGCGAELAPEGDTVGPAQRHQVTELPTQVAEIIEHQLHKVRCPACGVATRAELPAEVESGAFGPQLRAAIVMFASLLLSRRAIRLVMRDMFGAELSLGSVDRICKDAGAALEGPWEQLEAAVQGAEFAHADETSWRRAGERMWLWTVLSSAAACFRIDPTRARRVAKDLLEGFGGILVSDRYAVYDMFDPERRQVCLAHYADFRIMPTKAPSPA